MIITSPTHLPFVQATLAWTHGHITKQECEHLLRLAALNARFEGRACARGARPDEGLS